MESLPMRGVLAAAFVTYLLPYSEGARAHAMEAWGKIVGEEDGMDVGSFLAGTVY